MCEKPNNIYDMSKIEMSYNIYNRILQLYDLTIFLVML